MTTARLALHRGLPSQLATRPQYRVERIADLAEFLDRCERLHDGRSSPFHHRCWLEAWYATLGAVDGREPMLLAVRQVDGRDALLLPMTRRRWRGLWWAEYADAGIVDYVSPLTAKDWAGAWTEDSAARAIRDSLCANLVDCDVVSIDKLVAQSGAEGGQISNPLVLAWPTTDSRMFGHEITVVGDWEAWRRGLDKSQRKEIERCWRVFQRSPTARFERFTDPVRAAELLAVIEQQQSDRMRPLLGAAYRLDEPAYRDFYRRLVGAGVAKAHVVLTALLDGEHVVTAMLSVANDERLISLRHSLGADTWKHCSPGRLLDEQTARDSRESGRQHFDLGIGDYPHKKAWKPTRIPLRDMQVALSWRGQPVVMLWRLKRWLQAQPSVMKAWRRMQASKTGPVPPTGEKPAQAGTTPPADG